MSTDTLHLRLHQLRQEFEDTEARLADPDVVSDQKRYVELSRQYRALTPIVEAHRQLEEAQGDVEAAKELYSLAEGDEREGLRSEIAESEQRIQELIEEIRVLLLPRDPNDERNVIVEVRGAEGGEEANLFARDLYNMYKAFAANNSWSFETMSATESELGGFSECIFRVSGDGVWSRMKFEAGPHRVQRVPVTESQGRVHTSSATVAVLPEAEEVDVTIDPNDLIIDVYRSSGPGGQSVNTTDSAVRITHKPTGLVVSMQDEKSQIQNRAKALRVLRSRILQLEQQKQAEEAAGQKRAQIGGGGRSEKVRTYNFKENRVTDHRIGLTLYHLDRVLAGDLSEVSDALIAHERTERLEESAGPLGTS